MSMDVKTMKKARNLAGMEEKIHEKKQTELSETKLRTQKMMILASEVLNFGRQRILVNMRFLEPAVRALTERPWKYSGDENGSLEESTGKNLSKCINGYSGAAEQNVADVCGMGTDGKYLFYDPEYVLRAYQKEKGYISRMYLHLTLHGIFRHFFVSPRVDRRRWNLACDIAVEYIIESWKLDFADINIGREEQRESERIRKIVGLMNAEKIYAYLKKQEESEVERLEQIFRRDDHSVWCQEKKVGYTVNRRKSGDTKQSQNYQNQQSDQWKEENDQRGQIRSDAQIVNVTLSNQEVEELWKQVAQKIQVDLETFMKSRSGESGDFLVNLKLANRKKQDYSAFLRKFSRLGERMKINDEEFDYNFYTYGMQLYGNMPLIEPLEYKDIRIVKTFVTIIDTSGSVDEEKLRRFLKKTYQILAGAQETAKQVNFHLIQCDAKVQKDVKIRSEKELKQVMDDLTLYGRGGTDFRPAFEYVEELRRTGELVNLNGVLYFTDGLGIYPGKKPDYPVAFVYDCEGLDKIPEVPAWAIRYLLDEV